MLKLKSQSYYVLCVAVIFLISSCASTPSSYQLIQSRKALSLKDTSDFKGASHFIIAASGSNANFAQEVIEQKKLWIYSGIPASEIACYYVYPTQEVFDDDYEQYQKLSVDLKECYPAHMGTIYQHLKSKLTQKKVKKQGRLYFYITSHGSSPVSHMLAKINQDDRYRDYKKYYEDLQKYKNYEQYSIEVDANATGEDTTTSGKIYQFEQGVLFDDLYLTPKGLKGFLLKYYPTDKKVLILQACHSGGFIEDKNDKVQDQYTLRSLKNIVLLAASRSDKSSFGCNTASKVTFFGAGINLGLLKLVKKMGWSWKNLFDAASDYVYSKEIEYSLRVKSEPQYFSNAAN